MSPKDVSIGYLSHTDTIVRLYLLSDVQVEIGLAW
jgi:hypothetical protein